LLIESPDVNEVHNQIVWYLARQKIMRMAALKIQK